MLRFVYDITKDKSLLLILYYTLLFVAVVYFVKSFIAKSSKWVWLILLLVPCVCILPGAVEVRFFIGFYFLIFMFAILGLQEFLTEFKGQKAKFLIMYFVGFLIYVAYAGMLLATTLHGTATIN